MEERNGRAQEESVETRKEEVSEKYGSQEAWEAVEEGMPSWRAIKNSNSFEESGIKFNGYVLWRN